MADLKAPVRDAPKFDWTDERIARLKEMWAAGESAAVIGAEFGVTRNSIIGKVNRLRLASHKATPRKPKEPRIASAKARAKPNGSQGHRAAGSRPRNASRYRSWS